MKFLFLPMPYPDHYDWESSSGVLEPALSSELNVQLYWNVEEGERFIKAGTPLMQIVPIWEKDVNMVCFSSPFDQSAVDFLEDFNVPAFKIASFEITDIPLIEYTASKGKPVIISTGIAKEEDIVLAINACKNVGNHEIALLKCTSSYPSPIEEANLIMIQDLAKKFNCVSGLSDHTTGPTAAIAGTVLGAKIIEKHFILDRSIGGPDASFSMNEKEFGLMVKSIRDAEKSIGKINYNLTEKQLKGKEFSRSLYIVEDVKKNQIVTKENVKSIRPGYGLHPKYYNEILGKKFVKDIEKGERMNLDLVR